MYELKTNTAVRIAVGPLVDPTDGKTAETALTVTGMTVDILQMDNDGTAVNRTSFSPTASGGNNDMVHISSDAVGMYDLELTASQLNFLGNARLVFYDLDGFLVHWIDIQVVSAAYFDWKYGTTLPNVNVTQISGDGTAADNAELFFDGTGYAGGTTKLDVNVVTIANNAITAASINADAITNAKIANGAIDAATFAADVDAEIATMVWNAATASYGGAGTYGQAVEDTLADTNELQTNQGNWLTATGFSTHSAADVADAVWDEVLHTAHEEAGSASVLLQGATAPSAADVADAVWNETLADHIGAGSTGNALNAAGSSGDPWATALPGSYGAGTAGLLLGTTIPNAIDAIDNYVDTEIGTLTTELAKVPKSDGNVSWNATALAAIQGECTDALNAYDPPTNAEFELRTLPAADYTVVSDLGTVQTGDAFARLGAPAGESVSADIAAIKAETAAIVADTNELQVDDYPTSIAAVKTVVDAIQAKTDNLTFTAAGQVDANVQSVNDVALTGDGSATPWGPA